ncbi:MAG: hypothetical protein K0Q47_43 [Sedimentibacter sp.]|jgi:hypothetical protein|nr:hypothetical protein [Sedimentibacter sp.]
MTFEDAKMQAQKIIYVYCTRKELEIYCKRKGILKSYDLSKIDIKVLQKYAINRFAKEIQIYFRKIQETITVNPPIEWKE